MSFFPLFFISTSSKLGLRMSNYNDRKNYRYKNSSYSYNNSNQPSKISPLEGVGIQIVGTMPVLNKIIRQFSETFLRKQASNMRNEIYITHLKKIHNFISFFFVVICVASITPL